MVDLQKLDNDLQEIAKVKNKLAELGYDHSDYDDLEEELHDLEDDFIEEFGDYLEDALHVVHDEFCPDNDVLLPIAYLANKYIISEDNQFNCTTQDGVMVDADDFPGKTTRMVIIPNPTRIVLVVDKVNSQVVWIAGKS